MYILNYLSEGTTDHTVAASLWRIGSSHYTCAHGKGARPRKEHVPPEIDEARKARLEQYKINQLRLRTRRQALHDYKNRYVALLDKNIALKQSIESEEASSHDEVKKLLRKYEKFRGGIATLHDNFVIDKSRADADLERVKERTELSLKGFGLNFNI